MAYKCPIYEPIAIVGSSCRFAGSATSPSKLWQLLANPTDLSREIPPTRFNINAFYHEDGEYHGTTNSPKAYFIDQDHRVFDAAFFSIAPKEAEAIDPQQRLLLEVVYEAMESAGYTLYQYADKKVAVFAGLMTADYDTVSQRDDLSTSQYYATGNARSIIANRVSYFFNFKGPSMVIDTACSSSLVALHLAVLSLRSGECEMACVTGVNLIIAPEQFIVESSLHMLSPTGHCRMWDASANGYARGEGVTAMFVKPLSKALADGDRIEAIIRETGANSDGRSRGITMPNWTAQSNLIQDTYRRSGLDPRHIEDRCQYFEAHGTGTGAGDPNEARAIDDAFFSGIPDTVVLVHPRPTTLCSDAVQVRPGVTVKPPTPIPVSTQVCATAAGAPKLLVGSIKTLIGHTEGAAGLAGVLKVVQSIKHELVPPNLHLHTLSPNVKQYSSNILVPTTLVPWPYVSPGQPKRASVNSFGFGGTNSHAIIEQYVPSLHDEVAKRFCPSLALPRCSSHGDCATEGQINLPIVLSATSQKSLVAVIKTYRDYLLRAHPPHLEDLAWHTYARRTAFRFRVAMSSFSVTELVEKLDVMLDRVAKSPSTSIGSYARPDDEHPKILGIFTGQGAQWATMSRSLLQTSKVYADTIHTLDQVLHTCPHPPSWSLEQEILAEADLSRVQKAAVSQPVCTALQLALVDLLHSLGITFSTVVGHSSGEIAAAYASGRLTARDAILIAYYRGMYAYLASGTGGAKGGMLAVGLSKEEAAELCAKCEYSHGICIAASNSPTSVTLSGDYDILHRVREELCQQNKFARLLEVDTAYHSPHMELPAVKYTEALGACCIMPPIKRKKSIWVSSVYGLDEPDEKETASSYWKANMIKPVLFREALESALETQGPFDCAIEVGPHPTLKGPATQTIKAKIGNAMPYAGLLYRKTDDRVAFSQFLGWMWSQFGSSSTQIQQFVLGSMQPELVRSRLEHAPFYPWDHSQLHYRESRISRQYHFRKDVPHELLGSRTRDDNDFQMRWRNILKLDKLPWVAHHKFQNQALLPASAYLVMTVDAARVVLAGRAASIIELEDIKFPSGIILEENDPHGVEILFSLVIDRATSANQSLIKASFTVASAAADGRTTMKQNYSGKLRIVLEEPSHEALPPRPSHRAETMHANSEAFYHMMAGTGLGYSGPFMGLTALERRFRFASAAVKKFHHEDTTKLRISPATLDSCVQTSFLSVSSPGDGAIWTPFLPETIERARFNLAICDIQQHEEILAVDTYLTKETPFSRRGPASFMAEVDIYNSQGNMEIQIGGLTVTSFTSIKPEKDYELYLTTVMDVDPEDEIISSTLAETQGPSPMLMESCERVASYYIDTEFVRRIYLSYPLFSPVGYHMGSPAIANSWPGETEQSLETFVRASPYFHALEFVRKLGENLPDVLCGMLPTVVAEAHQLAGFQKHISRVVRQIAHKYPHMNVLGLTDPEVGLTEHILTGLGRSFATLRVGAEPEKNFKDRVVAPQSLRTKIVIEKLDLDLAAFKDPTGLKYDLVVLTTTLPETRKANVVLRKIRQSMRPGGFLILVDISRSTLKDRIRRCAGRKTASDVFTPLDWPGVLDGCGFGHSVNNSTQEYHPGLSFIIRQSDSHRKQMLLRPFAHTTTSHLVNRLLIVGGRQLWTSLISSGVCHALTPRCTSIMTAETLETVRNEDLSSCSAAILLNDIDEPILANLSKARMVSLRALLRPKMTVLWVTHNARYHNPDHAASFGFTRTLAAETPGLTLQVLDLDTIDTSPAVSAVSEVFARLAMESFVGTPSELQPLWVHESEIHVEDGRRLVPRVLPWKQGIQRLNAIRRIATDIVNSLENRVSIVPTLLEDGTTEYQSVIEQVDLSALSEPDSAMLQADYGTADTLNLGWEFAAHICLGRDTLNGKVRVALSTSNASYIPTPALLISTVLQEHLNRPLFIALLVRYLAALAIGKMVQDKPVLIIEPDPMFRECAKDVLVKRGIWFRVCTTNARHSTLTPGTVFIHPKSSAKDVKALYPRGGAWVFNMLPESDDLSAMLIEMLPKNCRYSPRSALLHSDYRSGQQDHDIVQELWHEAVSLAGTKSTTCNLAEMPPMTTVAALLGSLEVVQPFKVVDWKAERSIAHAVKPLVVSKMLSLNKTYVLIGVTRDFGQSLCSLFVEHGALHIVLASRHPPEKSPEWQRELISKGIDVRFEALDVTNLGRVLAFKAKLAESCLPVGGVVNGAMVLEDGIFSEMSTETFHRVMNPKTIGSKNLDIAFDSPELEFFIMTSSFAAIGGHPGQSNYAAANMYMNGLAATRRRRGLAGSALNIGVIYGLGFLHRERKALYHGLAREGYPPISERDIHHMFLEAIAAGKPASGQIHDITTGLRRYPVHNPTQHWHYDSRFSHFTLPKDEFDVLTNVGNEKKTLKELLASAETHEEVVTVFLTAFASHLEQLLQLTEGSVTGDNGIADLGVDSLVAVEIRSWIWKTVAQDVAVMKILGSSSIMKLCQEIVENILEGRITEAKVVASMGLDGGPTAPASRSSEDDESTQVSSVAMASPKISVETFKIED